MAVTLDSQSVFLGPVSKNTTGTNLAAAPFSCQALQASRWHTKESLALACCLETEGPHFSEGSNEYYFRLRYSPHHNGEGLDF